MKRSELLFLYDVKWANPNGDPLDENKPRMDEITDTLIVTDVRLKRTIRDYLKEFHDEELWVSGDAVAPDARAKELDIKTTDDAIEKCVDVRLFGAVIPVKQKGAMEMSLTGPVQFRYGRSLHRVKWEFVQGTAAFLSKTGNKQRSFREEYVVPYALIAFYGVINDRTALVTKLSDEDVSKLIEGMWLGTKNLITRSKTEHNPRLLIKVDYKDGVKYHHGELDYLVKFVSDKDDFEVRDVSDYYLELSELSESLESISDKIDSIWFIKDSRLDTRMNGLPEDIEKIFEFTEVKKIDLE